MAESFLGMDPEQLMDNSKDQNQNQFINQSPESNIIKGEDEASSSSSSPATTPEFGDGFPCTSGSSQFNFSSRLELEQSGNFPGEVDPAKLDILMDTYEKNGENGEALVKPFFGIDSIEIPVEFQKVIGDWTQLEADFTPPAEFEFLMDYVENKRSEKRKKKKSNKSNKTHGHHGQERGQRRDYIHQKNLKSRDPDAKRD